MSKCRFVCTIIDSLLNLIIISSSHSFKHSHRNSKNTSLHSCQIYKICHIAKQHHHSTWLSKFFMSYRTAPQEHTAQDCHNCINHKPALKRYRTNESYCSDYKEYIENIAADYISNRYTGISLACC